jgi:hypothetical protein
LPRICDSGSCRKFEAVIFGGITSPWGVHHLPKISSQDSKWFGRSIDRMFGANLQAVFWAVPGDPVTCARVTRCGSVRLRVTRSLVPIDPVGLSLFRYCSTSFVLASVLLPSLSSLVPKVSREVCVCFRLFVCDSQSCNWDIGRVLLRKNFYRLPFAPPSLVANPVHQLLSEPVPDS